MKILITGGTSMIGKATEELLSKNHNVHACSHIYWELRDFEECLHLVKSFKPDCIIHLAGYNGNIAFNLANPTDIYFNTGVLALNVLRSAELCKVPRVLTAISSCAYPDLSGEIEEKDFWNGLPNSTVDCHGLSKRILDGYGMQLKKRGINYTSCIINNSFGPYDSIDLNKTKVLTALIVRFLTAIQNKDEEITCWGDGSAIREFIYAKDVAKCFEQIIPLTVDRINLSSNFEISIKDLAEKIKILTGFTGRINWDTTKPNGQAQKKLSTKLMKELINIDFTDVDVALKETIEWVKYQL